MKRFWHWIRRLMQMKCGTTFNTWQCTMQHGHGKRAIPQVRQAHALIDAMLVKPAEAATGPNCHQRHIPVGFIPPLYNIRA